MIHELIIDQFGNYIIQRILSIVSPNIRGNMLKYIVSWYEEIKNLSFGQRLIAKLNERYNEFTSMVNNTYGNSILYNPNVNIYENSKGNRIKKTMDCKYIVMIGVEMLFCDILNGNKIYYGIQLLNDGEIKFSNNYIKLLKKDKSLIIN